MDRPTAPTQILAFDKPPDRFVRAAAALGCLFDGNQAGRQEFDGRWIFSFHWDRTL